MSRSACIYQNKLPPSLSFLNQPLPMLILGGVLGRHLLKIAGPQPYSLQRSGVTKLSHLRSSNYKQPQWILTCGKRFLVTGTETIGLTCYSSKHVLAKVSVLIGDQHWYSCSSQRSLHNSCLLTHLFYCIGINYLFFPSDFTFGSLLFYQLRVNDNCCPEQLFVLVKQVSLKRLLWYSSL